MAFDTTQEVGLFGMGIFLKSDARGQRAETRLGWIRVFHFRVADYFDPQAVQFRTLRVMERSTHVAGGRRLVVFFRSTPNRDMEIVGPTCWKAALKHKGRMGNGSVIKPGRRAVL